MKVIRESQVVSEAHYSHVFDREDEPGNGWSFSCDKDGNLLDPAISRVDRHNECLAGEIGGIRVFDMGVKRYPHSYYVPAIIECGCGTHVELRDSMTNCCQGCGSFYNGGGQKLVQPRLWGEETGERFDDSGQLIL